MIFHKPVHMDLYYHDNIVVWLLETKNDKFLNWKECKEFYSVIGLNIDQIYAKYNIAKERYSCNSAFGNKGTQWLLKSKLTSWYFLLFIPSLYIIHVWLHGWPVRSVEHNDQVFLDQFRLSLFSVDLFRNQGINGT